MLTFIIYLKVWQCSCHGYFQQASILWYMYGFCILFPCGVDGHKPCASWCGRKSCLLHFDAANSAPTQPRAFRWGTVTVVEAVAPGLGVRPLVVNLWCLSWHNRESILYRLLLDLFRLLIVITVNWFSIHTCQNSALKNAKFCIKKERKIMWFNFIFTSIINYFEHLFIYQLVSAFNWILIAQFESTLYYML